MAPSAIEVLPVTPPVTWKQPKSIHIENKGETSPILTIDDLIRRRSQEIPTDSIISYPSSGSKYINYTARQIDIFAWRVAQKYKELIPQRLSSSDQSVVGLLGLSNFEVCGYSSSLFLLALSPPFSRLSPDC